VRLHGDGPDRSGVPRGIDARADNERTPRDFPRWPAGVAWRAGRDRRNDAREPRYAARALPDWRPRCAVPRFMLLRSAAAHPRRADGARCRPGLQARRYADTWLRARPGARALHASSAARRRAEGAVRASRSMFLASQG